MCHDCYLIKDDSKNLLTFCPSLKNIVFLMQGKRFVMQLLQNPPLCCSTVSPANDLLYTCLTLQQFAGVVLASLEVPLWALSPEENNNVQNNENHSVSSKRYIVTAILSPI
jgi:hypothetical protein